MSALFNEAARVLSNEQVGPRLHLMRLDSPEIAAAVKPGQFVHMKFPETAEHILRRPFSVYSADPESGELDILYQAVGTMTNYMPRFQGGYVEMIGPIGRSWDGPELFAKGECSHVLLVGGGVGAAPLYLMARELVAAGCPCDVVLGAQTAQALVCYGRYEQLLGDKLACATDDGSFGFTGFCTPLVEERLEHGSLADGAPYDYLAVCGPEPLMKIVAQAGLEAQVRTQVSLEKRMACGIGACLSCVVDTKSGKKRSCVDGPVFDASEVIW